MKRIQLFILLIGIGVLFGSCKKDDGGTGGNQIPSPPDISDFTFPASAATSATLYAPSASVVVNQEFDIRFVLYNVTDVFGVALEMAYPAGNIAFSNHNINYDFFSPQSSTLGVRGTVGTAGLYAFGLTFVNGSNRTVSGSGCVMKVRFKATASGTASFTFAKLEIRKADGSLISLPQQTVSVSIQ
jgi:hypothetical protein